MEEKKQNQDWYDAFCYALFGRRIASQMLCDPLEYFLYNRCILNPLMLDSFISHEWGIDMGSSEKSTYEILLERKGDKVVKLAERLL